jgi:hypothetical protein
MKLSHTGFYIPFIFILFFTETNAQERINISAGVGTTEALNLGIRFQLKQSQIGFTIGSYPYKLNGLPTGTSPYGVFSTSYYHHFAGRTRYSIRKPWFYKVGISYLRGVEEDVIYKRGTVNLTLGRDLNLNKRFGVNICAGAAIIPYSVHTSDDVVYQDGTGIQPYPILELSVYYRFPGR